MVRNKGTNFSLALHHVKEYCRFFLHLPLQCWSQK
uniref:Uncharacterized protein n=1 Tax=Parascaris equorum TaxID=6256 RepID=A0A914RJS8_PAREQ